MKISTPTRKMTFGIIVKERNKMTMRNSQTEFTRTSPEIQFCLMLFRSELKELVNTIICFGENKQKKFCFIYLRYKIFPSSILPLLNGNNLQWYVNKLQFISPAWAHMFLHSNPLRRFPKQVYFFYLTLYPLSI